MSDFESKPDCPDCRGTGSVTMGNELTTNVVMCHCVQTEKPAFDPSALALVTNCVSVDCKLKDLKSIRDAFDRHAAKEVERLEKIEQIERLLKELK